MANFDRVTDCSPFDALRQQLQEALEILRIEFLGLHELPVYRPKLVPELHHPAGEKALDGFGRLGKNPPVRGEPRTLDREYEIVGRFVVPLGEAGRLLRSVVGAVDLDGRQLAAGEFQFPLLREVFGIEGLAPRLVGPSADTDP